MEPKLPLEIAHNNIWGQSPAFLLFFFFFFFISPRKRDFFRFSPISIFLGHQKQIWQLERVPCSQTVFLNPLKAIFWLKEAFSWPKTPKRYERPTELQSGRIRNPRVDSFTSFSNPTTFLLGPTTILHSQAGRNPLLSKNFLARFLDSTLGPNPDGKRLIFIKKASRKVPLRTLWLIDKTAFLLCTRSGFEPQPPKPISLEQLSKTVHLLQTDLQKLKREPFLKNFMPGPWFDPRWEF